MSTFRNIRANGVTFVPNSAGRLALFPTDGFLVEQLDDNTLWAWNQTLQMWIPESGSGGGGVSSVGLSLPVSVFSVSGSPVTTAGTLTGSFTTQTANTIFAGPTTGAAAAPTFRALVAADIPALPYAVNSFTTFSAPNGVPAVADSANDTFNISTDSNITATTATTPDGLSLAINVGTLASNLGLSGYVLKSGDSIQYLNVEGDPTIGVGYVEFSNNTGLSTYSPSKNFALSAAGLDAVIQVLYPNITGSNYALLDFSEVRNNDIFYKFPDVQTGNYHLATWEDSRFLTISGDVATDQGYLGLRTSTSTTFSTPPTRSGMYLFSSPAENEIGIYMQVPDMYRYFNFSTERSGPYTYTFQAGDGVVAFTSDISSAISSALVNYLPLAGGTMNLATSGLILDSGSDITALVLKAHSSQTTDIITFKNNAGTVTGGFNGNQSTKLYIGDTAAQIASAFYVKNNVTNERAQTIIAANGQSVNIAEWDNFSLTPQVIITKDFTFGVNVASSGTGSVPANTTMYAQAHGSGFAALRLREAASQSSDPIVLENSSVQQIWGVTAAGGVVSSIGAANAVSYGFITTGTKDVGVGMFKAGTNQLAFATNSTQAVLIDANQKSNFKASTTSGASTNLAAGTAPTSPVEGDFWNDSTMKNEIAFLDGIKQSRTSAIFTQTASTTVTNTVTETTLIGTGIGTTTLPANFFIAGKTIRVFLGGIYSTPIGTPSATIKIKLGSTVIATVTTTSLLASASNLMFQGEARITCRTTGASGTVMTHGQIEYSTGVTGTIAIDPLNNSGATTTVDTTASKVLDITITWDSASSTRIATSTICTVEVLN